MDSTARENLRQLRTPEAYQRRIDFLRHRGDALLSYSLEHDADHANNCIRKAEGLLREAQNKFPECEFYWPRSLQELTSEEARRRTQHDE